MATFIPEDLTKIWTLVDCQCGDSSCTNVNIMGITSGQGTLSREVGIHMANLHNCFLNTVAKPSTVGEQTSLRFRTKPCPDCPAFEGPPVTDMEALWNHGTKNCKTCNGTARVYENRKG